MSEWDKANKKIYKAIYHDRMLKDVASAYCELKAVGDKLQQENKELNKMYDIRLKESIEQDKKLEAIRKITPYLKELLVAIEYEGTQTPENERKRVDTLEILEVLGE